VFCLLIPLAVEAQTALEQCSEQFIGSSIENAPTVRGTAPTEPFSSNQHLCYRDDGVSFYAIEYWPEQFAPRWAAYKLSPDNYGTNGCATYTRDVSNCYIQEDTWDEFVDCQEGKDPFHSDHMLTGTKLSPNDFRNTGHDRGHIAPRQAFSWHVCGTYQTFTMANMSPQRAFLNQDIWQFLERQVLTWGIDDGPVYVVSGPIFRAFPHSDFRVYDPDHSLDPAQIYQVNFTMKEAVEQHAANHAATSSGDMLRPKRNAKPSRIESKVEDLRMPTGYFKVIYRPAVGTEPAHAIGFLIPHTFENLNLVFNRYTDVKRENVFWMFVSTIDLIEAVSEITFPGIPDSMKQIWGDDFFFARDESRTDLRGSDCGRGTPQGVLENSTKAERLAACTDLLN
jgi:DNA/RNA endonuclease G (NUC1)